MNTERIYFDITMTVNRLVHERYSKVNFVYHFPNFYYDEDRPSYEYSILKGLRGNRLFIGVDFKIEEIYNDNAYDSLPHNATISSRISFDKKEYFMYAITNKENIMSKFMHSTFNVQDGIVDKKSFTVVYFDFDEVENVV